MASRRCGRCGGRSILLLVSSLQLVSPNCCHCPSLQPNCRMLRHTHVEQISSIERQVLDFLAQMWLPIIFNFFSTIFTLIGLFGIYYKKPAHLSLYIMFQVISLSWNAFVIAFYLEVPPLSRDSEILNLGTGSRSWWESNGPHCLPQYNISSEYHYEPWYRPVQVHGCLLPFYAIETAQAAVHFILSLLAFFISIFQLITFCGKHRVSGEFRSPFHGKLTKPLFSGPTSVLPRPPS